MKKLLALILALCFAVCAAACSSAKSPLSSGGEGSLDVSGESEPDSSIEEDAPAPVNVGEGVAHKLRELRFYLPEAFIAAEGNAQTGPQRYSTEVTDNGVAAGTVITAMAHEIAVSAESGEGSEAAAFDLSDYVKNDSNASVARVEMSPVTINEITWYIGEWKAGGHATTYIYGEHNNVVYEFIIDKQNEYYSAAISMLKETLWFA